ncbi:hypothetical protein VXQ18_09810 [Brucella abortus]|nr:hypothetical protein [Brucella abortus]
MTCRNPGLPFYGARRSGGKRRRFRARGEVTGTWGWDGRPCQRHHSGRWRGLPAGNPRPHGEPYMTSRDNTRNGGGLGLGLFIAKTLWSVPARRSRSFRDRSNPGQGRGESHLAAFGLQRS